MRPKWPSPLSLPANSFFAFYPVAVFPLRKGAAKKMSTPRNENEHLSLFLHPTSLPATDRGLESFSPGTEVREEVFSLLLL